jgi:hypothetical protein
MSGTILSQEEAESILSHILSSLHEDEVLELKEMGAAPQLKDLKRMLGGIFPHSPMKPP